MKKQVTQYSVPDLSRALIRQYLIQKGMKSTLEVFQKEDTKNKTKINRSLLIEMVSLKNLCFLNKMSSQPQPTLLEVLVAYLNKKSQGKKTNFINTQPMAQFPTIEIVDEKKNNYEPVKKQQTKSRQKQRPMTSKPIRRESTENMQRRAQPLEKQSLKMIYQKLNKVEGAFQFKTEVQQLHNGNKQGRIVVKGQISNVPLWQNRQVDAQKQYVQVFEQEEPIENKLMNRKLEEGSGWNKKGKRVLQSDQSIKKQEIQQIPEIQIQSTFKHLSSKKNNQVQFLEEAIINKRLYQQQNSIKQETKKQTKIIKEQKIKMAKVQQKSTDLIVKKKIQIENQTNQVQVSAQQNQITEYPKPKKNRSQLRMVNKKQVSLKNIEVVEPVKKVEQQQQFIISNKEVKSIIDQLKPEQNGKLIQQISANKQKSGAKTMMTVGKKRKNKQQTSNEANYPTKFKFDQNFKIDIPQEVKYEYQPYNFDTIVISQQTKQLYPWMVLSGGINYKQKGGGLPVQKKRQEKIIASKDAEKLKKIIFQSAPPIFPKSWTQGFILSPFQSTPYGLKQIQGGPCGIIAVLQCYFLKQLLLCSGQNNYSDETLRQVCLVAAITNLLWKVKSTDKINLAMPARGASKVDITNVRMISIEANDFSTAFSGIWLLRDEFIGSNNHGVVSLLLSSVLTRGLEKIEEEMDCKQNPLIGNHGHCTQQFVNMLLTGQAISNVFDGVKLLDDYKLKGITQRSQFGFLTIFQTLKYIQVGKNLKNPIFPAWVICKEFHYHVIFAPHYLISQNHKSQKFDIVYFDGLYNCGDRIRLTVEVLKQDEDEDKFKLKDLPLIEQVMMTKWGRRQVSWNGSTKIL